MFCVFKENNTSIFSLTNRPNCDVTSIRTMKVKVFNGMVYTLNDVAYVLGMQANLISLGWLDFMDCKY